MRGVGSGLAITVHDVAQITTSFIAQWISSVSLTAALIVCSIVGAFGALVVALLPIEMRSRPLEDTVYSQPSDKNEK